MEKMTYRENDWESYFYDGENVLINNFDIHDAKLLRKKEYELVAKKNVLLYLSEPIENFSP